MAGYAFIYLIIFFYLEHRDVASYHWIHTALDDKIPFCEYFIVPYLHWFPYQVFAILYFIFCNKNKQEYYRLIKMLCMGMSLFLLISFVYPNIQNSLFRKADRSAEKAVFYIVLFKYG